MRGKLWRKATVIREGVDALGMADGCTVCGKSEKNTH